MKTTKNELYSKIATKCEKCDSDVTYGQMVDDIGYVCNVCNEFISVDNESEVLNNAKRKT